jgi:hypothetical protein
MLVSDVINDAKYGELQQLAVKSDDNAILSYINLGMLELYKRFGLRTEDAIITLSAHNTIYTLDGELSNVDMPSDGDLLYIVGIYDEYGDIVELNNEDDPNSVLTISYDTLQVPNPSDGTYLSVIYVAAPTRLTAPTDKVRLPASLYEALLHYIGYRGHGSVDGNVSTENNTHYMRFEKSCLTAREYGLITADEIPYRRVNTKGFL